MLKGWLMNMRQRTYFPGTFWGCCPTNAAGVAHDKPRGNGRTSDCQAHRSMNKGLSARGFTSCGRPLKRVAALRHAGKHLRNVAVQSLGPTGVCQGGDQLIHVLLGVAEDDGPSCAAIGAHKVGHYGPTLRPMARQAHVLHAIRGLQQGGGILEFGKWRRS